jgi:hypothetical protein
MRKKSLFMLVVVLIFYLTACSGGQQNNSVTDAQNTEKSNETIEVDKNLFDVEITIPAYMIGEDDPQQIKVESEKEEGVKDVIINSDGSITYKMTKAAHNKMMKDMKAEIDKTVQETINSDDYPSIIDIKVDKSYKEFTMKVDREKFENSFDGLAALNLGIVSMFYQIFDGTDAEAVKVTIHVEDSETGEVFKTFMYPDDLK